MNKNYYILVASNAENLDGELVAAFDIAKKRLQRNLWPLFSGTPHRSSIKQSDECLIYIGGNKEFSQHVIGFGTVDQIIPWNKNNNVDENIFTVQPACYIQFNNISLYEPPISMRLYLDKLTFIPENRMKWGAALLSGCRKISKEDYSILRK